MIFDLTDFVTDVIAIIFYIADDDYPTSIGVILLILVFIGNIGGLNFEGHAPLVKLTNYKLDFLTIFLIVIGFGQTKLYFDFLMNGNAHIRLIQKNQRPRPTRYQELKSNDDDQIGLDLFKEMMATINNHSFAIEVIGSLVVQSYVVISHWENSNDSIPLISLCSSLFILCLKMALGERKVADGELSMGDGYHFASRLNGKSWSKTFMVAMIAGFDTISSTLPLILFLGISNDELDHFPNWFPSVCVLIFEMLLFFFVLGFCFPH